MKSWNERRRKNWNGQIILKIEQNLKFLLECTYLCRVLKDIFRWNQSDVEFCLCTCINAADCGSISNSRFYNLCSNKTYVFWICICVFSLKTNIHSEFVYIFSNKTNIHSEFVFCPPVGFKEPRWKNDLDPIPIIDTSIIVNLTDPRAQKWIGKKPLWSRVMALQYCYTSF